MYYISDSAFSLDRLSRDRDSNWSNRKLTTREMSRLQMCPDGLAFDCGRTHVQKLLGNAVPSLLAEVLAREIRRQLLDDAAGPSPLKLMPDVRSPVPSPEPVMPVPAQYRTLVAEHADHPGARKRQPQGV